MEWGFAHATLAGTTSTHLPVHRLVVLAAALGGGGGGGARRAGAAVAKAAGDLKKRGFWSDVSVLTGDSDEGERVERVGASLGGA